MTLLYAPKLNVCGKNMVKLPDFFSMLFPINFYKMCFINFLFKSSS